MAGRDIIVIGASADGVEALTHIARAMPRGFPTSLFVVCRFPAGGKSVLPNLFSQAGPLLATHPADGDPFHPGHIYVAPPDRPLVLEPGGRMRTTRGPRENHHRPAVDSLFRSAAKHDAARVIAVVLSGALYDGAAGLLAVRAAGGYGIVQDPRDAQAAGLAARFDEQAAQAEEYAGLIQRRVLGGNGAGQPLEPPTQNTEP
jgi:two-component system chemotaxis response regulator CheB